MDRKLKQYLDSYDVKYQVIPHFPTVTALQTAESAHIAGKELAKSVILRVDGRLVMAVVPATHNVDLDRVRKLAGAEVATLAEERDFESVFDDCQPGAMPPFGNIWNLDVYVAEELAKDKEIAFNAGTHDEVVKLMYADFKKLVNPTVGRISEPRVEMLYW